MKQVRNRMWRGLAWLQAVLIACIGMLFLSLVPAQAGINEWSSTSPEGARVSSMAISPNYASDGTLFAGSASGGIYRSTNSGTGWSLVLSGMTATVILVSPNYASDATLFAGGADDSGTKKIYKSTNGGSTWASSTPSFSLSGNSTSLAISPNYGSDATLLAAAGDGVYKSTDGAANWSRIDSGFANTNQYAVAFASNYASSSTIFAGTSNDSTTPLYKSTNGGSTWSPKYNAVRVSLLVSSPNYGSDSTLLATDFNGQTLTKSTDGGNNWTTLTGAVTSYNYAYQAVFSPNYASDTTLFVATGSGIRKSTDNGANWSALTLGSSKRTLAVIVSPNYASDTTLFGGTDTVGDSLLSEDGTYKSTNGGSSWSKVVSGMHSLDGIKIVLSPNYASDSTLFMSLNYAAEGAIYKSTDAGATWARISIGATTYVTSIAVSPNYASDSTLLVSGEYSSGGDCGIWKSTNGGSSWSKLTGYGTSSVGAVAFSPNYVSDTTIFAGSSEYDGSNNYGFFRSTDNGSSWTRYSTGLGTGKIIYNIAVSPNYTNDSTVFVTVLNQGVYKMSNWGSGFSAVNSGISASYVKSLAISPNYANDSTLYVGMSGAGNTDAICRTTNGGSSWGDCGLSGKYVRSIAISPNYANDKIVFLATNSNGVQKTINGTSWSDVSGNLPTTRTVSVALVPNYAAVHNVFLVTSGYGIYKADLD